MPTKIVTVYIWGARFFKFKYVNKKRDNDSKLVYQLVVFGLVYTDSHFLYFFANYHSLSFIMVLVVPCYRLYLTELLYLCNSEIPISKVWTADINTP